MLTEVRQGDIVEWALREWEVMGIEGTKAVLSTDGGFEYRLPIPKLMQQAKPIEEPECEKGYVPTEHEIVDGVHANVLTGYEPDSDELGLELEVRVDHLNDALRDIRKAMDSLRGALGGRFLDPSDYSYIMQEAVRIEAELVKAIRGREEAQDD